MAIQQHLYDIDDLWRMVCEADDDRRYELIEGELVEMPPPGEEHGYFILLLGKFLLDYVIEHQLGRVTADSGFHAKDDRYTLLGPDIAFRRLDPEAEPASRRWVPSMPDLAVEIKSPSNTMTELRRKVDIYLRHGTRLVWIIIPDSESVEVHRLGADGARQREVIGSEGQLSGEEVLPGFTLSLTKLFA